MQRHEAMGLGEGIVKVLTQASMEGQLDKAATMRLTKTPIEGTCKGCGVKVEAFKAPVPGRYWTPAYCGLPWNPGDREAMGCQGRLDKEEYEQGEIERAKARRFAMLTQAGVRSEDVGILAGRELSERLRHLKRREEREDRELPWFGLIAGEPGTGKSSQLVAAAEHYIDLGWSVRYISQQDMLDSLKPGEGGLSADFVDVDLLCLDEWAMTKPTAWATEQLMRVLDMRHRQQRPTLLATTKALDWLYESPIAGERLMDRVLEACGVFDDWQHPKHTLMRPTKVWRGKRRARLLSIEGVAT